ncbi:2-oxoacid dehydrogenases acyltransferase-domain-containing protein [Zychaea mexicana]|uniref:2-oxoacid dehydrogenases acyltransferase-domain-containing protein n=1 Tax=Zychaea mexicana TaxID=64656 RepID=UPI0022FDEEDA|nr:2-oxoacid dehydrogenases acyltransferase-domain-containing protein [Zychaea mexicana]KAI9489058.1 2-oxoacid dehydrogenases acyltransferase-domain-containing protein [Zychaea mexicana]
MPTIRALRCRRQLVRTASLLTSDNVKNSRRIFPTAAVRTPIVQKAGLHARPVTVESWAAWNSHRTFHASASTHGIKPFLLADIGEGITECEVIQWFVQPGDTVAEFEKICEVQSDKASVEITSRYSGKVVKLHYDVNDVAKVGQALVDIDVEGEEADAPASAPSAGAAASTSMETKEPDTSVTPPSATPTSTRELKDPSLLSLATPAVRRIAKQNNIDIKLVRGTGKDGRVLKEDVMAYISNGGQPSAQQPTPSPVTPVTPSTGDRLEPLTTIQKAMFKSMTKSLAIPQLGYKDEMELNATTQYRAALNKHIASNPAMYPFKKISYMPVFIKCLSIALTHYPIMNASLAEGANAADVNSIKLLYRKSHNIGLAMDTPQGLIVPNIKNVQDKTVMEVAAEIHRLTELGAKNSIPPADLQGGTLTLSNIGTVGGTYANPVIVSSELAIVALGRMQTLPRFDEVGNVVAKQILPVSWSADHRVIDGATIARFGNYWKNLVENPALLASELR